MTTKELGILGETQVLAKFASLGIPVSIPFGDNSSYDLIVELKKKLYKIQVKTSSQTAEDKIVFKIAKTRINQSENITSYYTEEEVDFYALYSITKNEIYLVPFKEAANKEISIRHQLPKNGQVDKIKMDYNYLIDNKIKDFI